ncbi:hypothetical protein PV08_00076 [Exophiala spinifera]|uniref:Ubiquitin carrier protein n=1 Tax=Exophiala spinifera TaxID=91928 RepID=A0A0D2C7K8_9EURO|nr:uncharacterized protein PV08_00076 [Exophiala spinifera]KIW19504.1 hypothetical protein PV08_00076 [Exophiala spinifera]
MSLTWHIAPRGLEAVHGMLGAPEQSQPDDGEAPQVAPVAALVFFLSAFAVILVMFTIVYTYGHILPTLCMIESPETEAYVPVDIIEPTSPPAYSETPTPKTTDEEDGGDLLLVRNKPVTASIRATILHLRARAGYWSRLRGLSMFIVWSFVSGFFVSTLGTAFGSRLGFAFAAILVETMLSTLHMAWIHIVISEPNPKRWYQRIPSVKTWPKIAPAVALWATANQVVAILPRLVCGSFGSLKHMNNPDYTPDKKDLYAVGAQGVMGMFLTVLLFVLLQIPASVTMVRVAASMLPEEDETIVPFDRTFGGKTTPTILGGQGKIGLVEAWRSFAWSSRVRLVKLMIKVAVIVMALWLFFTMILVAEAHLLFGDKLGEMMRAIHGVVRHQ